jgi:hypothetical protein
VQGESDAVRSKIAGKDGKARVRNDGMRRTQWRQLYRRSVRQYDDSFP